MGPDVPPMISTREPSRRPFLVIGNSHATAVEAALLESPDERFDIVNLASYFDAENRRNKTLPRQVVELFQPRRIFCCFGGSEHSVLGLLEMPVRFDFMMPGDEQVDPARQFVPCALVRETLELNMRRGLEHLRLLRELYACPIVHFCSPPPFRELVRGHRLPGTFMKNLHLGLSPAPLRRRLHALHSDIVRRTCAKSGVDFMPVPAECMDGDGYLRPGYWSTDPTHGNARYGALIIRRFLEIANG